MVTITSSSPAPSMMVEGVMKSREVFSFAGLSTDTKPTGTYGGTRIGNGSVFLEMNTSDAYMYDEANSVWRKLG